MSLNVGSVWGCEKGGMVSAWLLGGVRVWVWVGVYICGTCLYKERPQADKTLFSC
jgi:hypothetical protein